MVTVIEQQTRFLLPQSLFIMLFYRGGIIWQRKAGSPGSCSNTQLSLVGLVLLQGTKELLMNRVILGGHLFLSR